LANVVDPDCVAAFLRRNAKRSRPELCDTLALTVPRCATRGYPPLSFHRKPELSLQRRQQLLARELIGAGENFEG
jgi:hypothetical protein